MERAELLNIFVMFLLTFGQGIVALFAGKFYLTNFTPRTVVRADRPKLFWALMILCIGGGLVGTVILFRTL